MQVWLQLITISWSIVELLMSRSDFHSHFFFLKQNIKSSGLSDTKQFRILKQKTVTGIVLVLGLFNQCSPILSHFHTRRARRVYIVPHRIGSDARERLRVRPFPAYGNSTKL